MENIKEIKFGDENYPELLRKIAKPPKILYYQGQFKRNELCFGVVGTRKCSPYGRQVALDIVGKLADSEITIVSGLAPGIDTFAHQSCVEKNKRTIAVLGTGLDEKSIYPQLNIALSRKILETGGCLISELPPGTSGSKFTFPDRNRIISGLSQGVLIIEAKTKSGSLITANYAFKQNRKVFAIPGSIYSSNSTGANRLIKQGAKLVDSVNDILQELNLPASLREALQTGLLVENHKQNYNRNLTPEEKLIIKALAEESLYIDKIIEKTKLTAIAVAGALAVLEIEGYIRNLGGNIYALSR